MKVKCPKCDCEFESEGYSEGRAAFLGMVMGGLGVLVGLMIAALIFIE